MKARSFGSIQSKLAMLIYGKQFTGKSTMASQFAYFKRPDGKPFRVLYLDAEFGSIDDMREEMVENGVLPENVYIIYTSSISEIKECIRKVKDNEDFYEIDEEGNELETVVLDADGQPFRADAIVVDGSTVLNLTTKQSLVEFSKKRNRVKAIKNELTGDAKTVAIEGAGLELKDYQTVAFKGQDFILDLMACGVHFAVTARETDEKETVKDSTGKISSVSTGRKIPEGFKDIEYNVRTVIRMYRDPEDKTMVVCQVEKDRTHVHSAWETVENPTLLDWQQVIDRTGKNKNYVLKNDLNSAVGREAELYSKEILKGTDEDNAVSNSNDLKLESLLNKAKSLQGKCPPTKRANVKNALSEKGLPSSLKGITDIKIIEEYVAVLEENIK